MSLVILTSVNHHTMAENKPHESEIVSVKLYQNQAMIYRQTKLWLEKGTNSVVIGNIPPLLHDWSIRGSLPKDFGGKINSLEVEQKALTKKRQDNIVEIEGKLEILREKDQVLIDDLKNINSQEKFLNSVIEFTNTTVSRELATRIPKIQLWDDTLEYVSKKRTVLLREKRRVEKEREKIGKEIQKWEFELSQIAGTSYYRTYQTLNKSLIENRSAMNIQQYSESTGQYEERKRLFTNPTEKVDIEKRLNASIYSPEKVEIVFSFCYVIPQTSWQMKYDIRANSKNKTINMIVYGDIYQKTGENWDAITLALSTGKPVNTISPPVLKPWYLDVETTYQDEGSKYKEKEYRSDSKKKSGGYDKMTNEEDSDARIKEAGSYFEIELPARQNILSSEKYQKKYIKEYSLEGDENVNFYYEVTPEKAPNAFLKTKIRNTANLPWLEGEAQIFLENEFMGKASIPFMPQGKVEEFVIGNEPRIIAKKELVKKYEDTAGIMGGKRRIQYSYKLTVENQLADNEEVIVCDLMPVTRNEKIKIEIEKLSDPWMSDEDSIKSVAYAQGTRKWKFKLPSHGRKEILYDIYVTFDKEIKVWGLR